MNTQSIRLYLLWIYPEVGFKHGKYQDTETYALLV